MSARDDYQKAADALEVVIRAARELIEKRDPRTYELAQQKRAMEKQLRAAGYTKTEAAAEVARVFRIDSLGDNER